MGSRRSRRAPAMRHSFHCNHTPRRRSRMRRSSSSWSLRWRRFARSSRFAARSIAMLSYPAHSCSSSTLRCRSSASWRRAALRAGLLPPLLKISSACLSSSLSASPGERSPGPKLAPYRALRTPSSVRLLRSSSSVRLKPNTLRYTSRLTPESIWRSMSGSSGLPSGSVRVSTPPLLPGRRVRRRMPRSSERSSMLPPGCPPRRGPGIRLYSLLRGSG